MMNSEFTMAIIFRSRFLGIFISGVVCQISYFNVTMTTNDLEIENLKALVIFPN